ncbi:hypothetical protein BH09BAC4_BH09BAC4_11510 [soil metagenome]
MTKGKRKLIKVFNKKSIAYVGNCGNRTAEAARDIKKSCRHFQSRRGTATNLTLTYRFIQFEETNFPVRLLCKVLNVSKTAYYTYLNGTTFTPSDSDLAMTTAIDKIFCGAARAGKLPTLW